MNGGRSGASVLLLHGPNLALLGRREPHLYGPQTLADVESLFEAELATAGTLAGLDVSCTATSTDSEGELVSLCGQATTAHQAIVINPGALTHYSWALHDALRAFEGPVVEVHLSNPQAREPFRHGSVVAPVSSGTISGFGITGYALAATAVVHLLAHG